MTKIKVELAERKYFTMLPNIVDDMHLSPIEFRLYVHLRRVAGDEGRCWQSTRTLAEACDIGAGSVSKAKKLLTDRSLITVSEAPGPNGTYHLITVVDIWQQNMESFHQMNASVHLPNTRSLDERKRSPPERKRSPGETKKNTLRKTNEEDTVVAVEETEEQELERRLSGWGVKGAHELVTSYPHARIEAALQLLATKDNIDRPAGFLVNAIREGWGPPPPPKRSDRVPRTSEERKRTYGWVTQISPAMEAKLGGDRLRLEGGE